jgi:hypothetical protein
MSGKALMCFGVFALLATVGGAAVLAGSSHTSFDCSVGLVNPCNGEFVALYAPCSNLYHENSNKNGSHYKLQMTIIGSADGNQGNTYNVSFIANGQFDAPTGASGNLTWFDTPYQSNWAGLAGAPGFGATGTVRLWVVGGEVVGGSILSAVTSCK